MHATVGLGFEDRRVRGYSRGKNMGVEGKTMSHQLKIQKAHNLLDAAVCDVVELNPDLTYLEMLAILNQISASWIKRAVQDERNPSEVINKESL
jgi:hypothetical protein